MTLVFVFVTLVFLYGLVSGRLQQTLVTAPIVFTAAGAAAFLVVPTFGGGEGGREAFLLVAEVGLVLLLFTDGSRTNLRVLRDARNLPVRLLSVGMLLTILLGGLAAWLVLPGLSLWEAAILGAVLAPTDAGLGQVIVSDTRVPIRIRETLNVEAGLNDGLSVPFLLFFIAMARSAGDVEASLMRLVIEQLGYGTLIGAGIGLGGGWLLGLAHNRKWVSHSWRQLGVVALPLLCMLASEQAGASMFIAAFVAGLVVQVGFKETSRHSIEFTEEWGQLFNLAVFYLFGLLAARAWPELRWSHVLYALLSLTVIRMAPVALALVGTRLCRATVLFIGWFGPRGLASIVLGLVYLEQELHLPGEPMIRGAILVTVLVSIFAHGLSARPGMHLYSRRLARLPPEAPEFED